MGRPRKALLSRGGARNRADRQSESLTEFQCRALLDGAARAVAAGRPFNRFITILWQRGGIDPRQNARATGAFVKLASDWARRHGYRLPWGWVQEWGRVNGAHVHLLLHVPPDLDRLFRPMPRRWVKGLLPAGYVPRVVQSQRIRGRCSGSIDRVVYCANLERKLAYIMKAAPSLVADRLGLLRSGVSCPVFGKRAAVWQGAAGGNKIGENREIA